MFFLFDKDEFQYAVTGVEFPCKIHTVCNQAMMCSVAWRPQTSQICARESDGDNLEKMFVKSEMVCSGGAAWICGLLHNQSSRKNHGKHRCIIHSNLEQYNGPVQHEVLQAIE